MLWEQVCQTVEKYHMLQRCDDVVVGLSGGADSVALLHCLWRIQNSYGFSLRAVHVHHGLRGADADEDAAFSEAFAKSLGILCHIVAVDMPGEAKARGLGLEETGRLLRYEAFDRFAKANSVIAVAHNQNDQAETVLMRLCRGAGTGGLSGIRPVRGNIIRPLLYCSRKDIEGYCLEQGLSFRTDKTNLENEYTRNKIRNCLLPWLCQELNDKAVENIGKTAEILAEEERFLSKTAEEAFQKAVVFQWDEEVTLNREVLFSLPAAIRRRALRHALHQVAGKLRDIGQIHVEKLEELLQFQSGRRISLPQGLAAEMEFQNLAIYRANGEKSKGYCYTLESEKTIFIKEIKKYVRLSFNAEKNERNFGRMYTEVWDCDKIKNVVCCRTRQPGDRLAIGGGHTKKIKDFFVDEKIPKRQRDNWPLIAVENEILWVIGKRRAESHAPDSQSKNTAVIQIWEDNEYERETGNVDFPNSNQQAY